MLVQAALDLLNNVVMLFFFFNLSLTDCLFKNKLLNFPEFDKLPFLLVVIGSV